ncbi:MAG: hypothetical protein AABZ06_09110 [Bdellovibrionota bacterium]
MTEIKKRLIKFVALPMVLIGIILIVSQIFPIREWILALSTSKQVTVLDYLDNLGGWASQQLQRSQDPEVTSLTPEERLNLIRRWRTDNNRSSLDGTSFQERVITRETFLYDKDGKSIKKLEPGKIVRLLIPEESLHFEGFSEKCVLVSIVQVTDEEIRGYVRESAVSEVEPEEHRRKLGIANAVWWDLPLDSNVVVHKAVQLQPGQVSEFLTVVIKESIRYWLYRPNRNVKFRAWINGQEIRFGPGEHQQCPEFDDFVRVRVQLSEFEGGPQTIRFCARRI